MYLQTVLPCLLALSMADVSQQQPPPQPKPAPAPKQQEPRRTRVVTRLEGFELTATTKLEKQTTVAAASRGFFSRPLLVGPLLAKQYSIDPVLTWIFDGPPDATFTVRLYNEDEELIHEATVTGRKYRYGGQGQSLKDGRTYYWTAEVAGMPASRSEKAGLKIIDASERTTIAAKLAAATGAAEVVHLKRADVFVAHRLWYDALAEFDAAVAAAPESAVAHERRGELLAQLPAFQALADAAFAKADALRRDGR